MASTSAPELAQTILDECLQYGTWPSTALDALVERALDEEDQFAARAATRALFSIVIERLGDLFEPSLCEIYAKLFAHVISRAVPEFSREELLMRYKRVRQVRRFQGGEVNRVFVLSRVTLGADIVVTSMALQACKLRFPEAEICLVGPQKNAELFGADPRISPISLAYGRTSLLKERLLAAIELRTLVDELGSIVVDPDSRLTQLGLIPVCDDARYYFFESRAFGGELPGSLSDLTGEWIREVFDAEPVQPYVAPVKQQKISEVTVSWGVGENTNKRVNEDFETAAISALLDRGLKVLLDCGAGDDEASRAAALQHRLGSPDSLHLHHGSYASFASHIAQSRLYVGYDSAGQHVASAAGVPLISVFAGYPCARMLSRWSPSSPSAKVIAVDAKESSPAVAEALHAIATAASEVAEALRATPTD